MKISVYRAIDPRDERIRWVGRTRDLKKRLAGHLLCQSSNLLKNAWVNDLKLCGLIPRLEVIEEVEPHEAKTRETYWVRYYAAQGYPLLNIKQHPPRERKPAHIGGRKARDAEFWEKVKHWQDTGECPWKSPARMRYYLKTTHGVIIP